MKLTAKQREVRDALIHHPGSMAMQFSDKRSRRVDRCSVVIKNEGAYDVILDFKLRTLEALLRKGVVKFKPHLSENYDGWQRFWYTLADNDR